MSNPFEKVLGTTPELLVLEEILSSSPLKDDAFTIREIREMTGVPRKKVKKVFKKFLKWEMIIKFTKLEGPFVDGNLTYYDEVQYYKLNADSLLIKATQAFNNALVEEIIGEEACHKIHDYLEENEKVIPSATNHSTNDCSLKLKVDQNGCIYDETTGTIVDVE